MAKDEEWGGIPAGLRAQFRHVRIGLDRLGTIVFENYRPFDERRCVLQELLEAANLRSVETLTLYATNTAINSTIRLIPNSIFEDSGRLAAWNESTKVPATLRKIQIEMCVHTSKRDTALDLLKQIQANWVWQRLDGKRLRSGSEVETSREESPVYPTLNGPKIIQLESVHPTDPTHRFLQTFDDDDECSMTRVTWKVEE